MNMPAFNLQQTQTPAQIANIGHFTTIGNIRWQSAYQLMVNPQLVTQMLDERFPLDNGSHADVKQYIVYFRHVMAFFKDGSYLKLRINRFRLTAGSSKYSTNRFQC